MEDPTYKSQSQPQPLQQSDAVRSDGSTEPPRKKTRWSEPGRRYSIANIPNSLTRYLPREDFEDLLCTYVNFFPLIEDCHCWFPFYFSFSTSTLGWAQSSSFWWWFQPRGWGDIARSFASSKVWSYREANEYSGDEGKRKVHNSWMLSPPLTHVTSSDSHRKGKSYYNKLYSKIQSIR